MPVSQLAIDPAAPLMRIEALTTRFQVRSGLFGARGRAVHAAQDVSFSIGAGEIVGLIGESGSGKTTVARAIVGLDAAATGAVVFDGKNALALRGQALKHYRREVQAIFQDPAASLDPLMRVKDLVAEPSRIHRIGDRPARDARVAELLQQVGLGPEALNRYPHQFSGGQRQRIGIARALATRPRLIVADEPVSALDVSVQAQILNLFQALRQDLGLALLFISHDLPTVEFLCDRVVVMYLGRVVETAPAELFQKSPLHPYSRRLVADAPRFGGQLRRDAGAEPSGSPSPTGCVFQPRCAYAVAACSQATPALEPVSRGGAVACIRRELF